MAAPVLPEAVPPFPARRVFPAFREPTGQTDAQGRFTTTTHLDSDSERINLTVQATSTDGRLASMRLVATPPGFAGLKAEKTTQIWVHSDPNVQTGSHGEVTATSGNIQDSDAYRSANAMSVAACSFRATFGMVSATVNTRMTAVHADYRGGEKRDSASAWADARFKDKIIVNDPQLTGKIGVGRIRLTRTNGCRVTANFYEPDSRPDWESYVSAYWDISLDSGVLRSFMPYFGGAFQGIRIINASNFPPYKNEDPLPEFTPIIFRYGEPIDIDLAIRTEAHCRMEINHNPPFSGAGEASAQVLFRFIPENTEATVVTESGASY